MQSPEYWSSVNGAKCTLHLHLFSAADRSMSDIWGRCDTGRLRCSGLVAGGCPLYLNADTISSGATDDDECALPQLNKQIKERLMKIKKWKKKKKRDAWQEVKSLLVIWNMCAEHGVLFIQFYYILFNKRQWSSWEACLHVLSPHRLQRVTLKCSAVSSAVGKDDPEETDAACHALSGAVLADDARRWGVPSPPPWKRPSTLLLALPRPWAIPAGL